MSAIEVGQKIALVELALKDAGPAAVANAIIDTLKEIARTLEVLERKSTDEL